MKPIAILNESFNNYLYINYVVSTVCNYKCYYCFPGANDGKYKFPKDITLLKTNLGHVLKKYRDKLGKTNIRINLAGGEPSLWPLLGEFAEYFYKEFDCRLTLATNGSRTLRFWQEYAKYFEDICISVHNEAADIEHVKAVMDWIYENTDCLINGLVLMDHQNWDKCIDIVNDLQSHPVPWLLKVRPLIIDDTLVEYTEEQNTFIKDKMKKIPPKEWIQKMKDLGRINNEESGGMQLVMEDGSIIKSDTHHIMENEWYRFAGWKCNLGVDRFQINPAGDIDGSCGARNLFNLAEPLSIYAEDFIEKFNNVELTELTCRQLACTCPTEVKIPKYSPKYVQSN